LNNQLSFPDGVKFCPDVQNGKYGFNTDPARGADTFIPFLNLTWVEGYTSGTYQTIKTPGKPQIILGTLNKLGYGCFYININGGKQSSNFATFDNWLTVHDDGFTIGSADGYGWHYKYAY
ncbi:MAG: hypothetical protein NC231_12275, partial [Bacillus sp. (in: Bacteria)]|nr:hypothetical protein [Bacillus sp. (in: firmicutes)]